VKIDRPFAIGKYEVTRNQFSVFASETGRGAGGGCEYFAGRKWQQSDSKGWNDPGFHQTGSDPVTCVSWNDAQAYLNWLSRKTGRLYRLPSESEWEYAARANTETARYWGNDTARACGYANLHDQTGNRVNHFKWTHYDCDDGYAQTAPVGRFQANAFGLHDILGNIVELIEDCLHENYEGAPTDGSAWVGGTDCARRMVRGGFWILNPWFSRSAFRGSDKIDFRRSSLGFRAALTVPTPR
jgi:formylglycine-generating enzyme required for sulfatase activity